MTEEDTFRKLKQMPFDELRKLLRCRMNVVLNMEKYVEFLASHGWTIGEYISACAKVSTSKGDDIV